MAKNNINNNNQASKFSSLLGGLKAETKPSLSDLLDQSDSKSNANQPVSGNNEVEGGEETEKLKSSGSEQKNNNVVVDTQNRVNPGEEEIVVPAITDPEPKQNPAVEKSGDKGVGEVQTHKKNINANAEPKPKITNKKTDTSDYDRFLQRCRNAKSKSIFINEEYDILIGKIVNQIGEPGLTKAGYLENVLTWHFETFGKEIKKRRKEALEKENNDL